MVYIMLFKTVYNSVRTLETNTANVQCKKFPNPMPNNLDLGLWETGLLKDLEKKNTVTSIFSFSKCVSPFQSIFFTFDDKINETLETNPF